MVVQGGSFPEYLPEEGAGSSQSVVETGKGGTFMKKIVSVCLAGILLLC